MNTQPSISSQPLRAQMMEKLKEAMKQQNRVALDALRYMLSLIKNAEIDLKHEVSDLEFVGILQKEVKRRKEAIEQFLAGGRNDAAEDEKAKLVFFSQFLPTQMSVEEIEASVKEVIEGLTEKTIPNAMKAAMEKLRGMADGRDISNAVKKLLQ